MEFLKDIQTLQDEYCLFVQVFTPLCPALLPNCSGRWRISRRRSYISPANTNSFLNQFGFSWWCMSMMLIGSLVKWNCSILIILMATMVSETDKMVGFEVGYQSIWHNYQCSGWRGFDRVDLCSCCGLSHQAHLARKVISFLLQHHHHHRWLP